MTQEDKELLLKDLCSRLPYGVIVKMGEYSDYKVVGINLTDEHPINLLITSRDDKTIVSVYAKSFKPYLRPMSSMTEREKEEFENITSGKIVEGGIVQNGLCIKFATVNVIEDWLNAHHFDYRDLIPKGLAIAVTKENNPYK